jgi:hypothetical protein
MRLEQGDVVAKARLGQPASDISHALTPSGIADPLLFKNSAAGRKLSR